MSRRIGAFRFEPLSESVRGTMFQLATLLLHAPLFYAGYRIANRLSNEGSTAPQGGASSPDDGLSRLTDTFIVTCALWSAECILLGSVGLLSTGPILLTHVVIAGLSIPFGSARSVSWGRAELVLLGVILATGGVTALLRTLHLPDPYDSLTYHLFFPARWFDAGRLEWIPTAFGDLAPTYAPAFVEHFFLASYLPFGSDAWARIGQFPFLVLLFISIAQIVSGRRDSTNCAPAQPDRPASSTTPALVAGAAALVGVSLPELWGQATSSLADVAAASLVLAVWARLDAHASRGRVVIAALAAGLFLASRYTSLVYFPVLFFGAWITWRDWRRRAVFVAIAGGLGAYAYLRNALMTGNPVFPVALEFAGWSGSGLYTREATLASVFRYQSWEVFRSDIGLTLGSFGLIWLVLGSVLPWLALAVSSRNGHQDRAARRAVGCFLAAAALCALHFLVVPYTRNLRFLFPAWALFVVAGVLSMTLLIRLYDGNVRRFGWGVFAALSCATLIDSGRKMPAWLFRDVDPSAWPWGLAGNAGLAGDGAALGSTMAALGWLAIGLLGGTLGWIVADLSRWQQRVLAIALVLGATVGLSEVDHDRKQRWSEIYRQAPRYRLSAVDLEQLAELPTDSKVVYVGRNLPYLVRGEAAGRRVFTIPTDGSEKGAAPHLFLDPTIPPSATSNQVDPSRRSEDFEGWRDALIREGVDRVIVLGATPVLSGVRGSNAVGRGDPVERAWMRESDQFVRIYPHKSPPRGMPVLEIYRTAF